jgi:hypothetical protein
MIRGQVRSEVRRRLPRIMINLTVAVLFWIVSQIGPLFVEGLVIPIVNFPPPFDTAPSIVRLTATLIWMVFLVKAISDILFFVDLSAEIIVRSLGIKDRKRWKRVARDLAYIILALLLVAAATPIVSSIPQVGGYLMAAISLAALAFFLLLIYDIGKVIHGVLQEKTRKIADWIGSRLEETNHGASERGSDGESGEG